MSQTRQRTSPAALAEMPSVQRAWRDAERAFEQAYRRLEPFENETLQFHQRFAPLSEQLPVDEWASALLEHHRRVQRGKPPSGKNPFFERFDDGSVIVRPGYLRSTGGRGDDAYVHQYRTWPLWLFSRDLRMVGQ